MRAKLVTSNVDQVIPGGKLGYSRKQLSSLDRFDETQLVVYFTPLEQLLAKVIPTRGVAEILRPFNDGIDQDGGGIRIPWVAETVLRGQRIAGSMKGDIRPKSSLQSLSRH